MSIISSTCVNIPEIIFVRVAMSSFVADCSHFKDPTIVWQLSP